MRFPVVLLLAGLLQASPGWCRYDWYCDRSEAGSACGDDSAPESGAPPDAAATAADPAADGSPDIDQPAAQIGYIEPSAWAVCPPPPPRDYDPLGEDRDDTQVSGLSATRDADNNYVVTGDVRLRRSDTQILADRVEYHADQAFVEAHEGMTYDGPDQQVTAARGRFWIDEKRGKFEDTRYRLYDLHAHGNADEIALEEPGIVRLKDANYTTCPDGSKVWVLKARKVKLDKEEGFGTARSTSLEIQGVPLFYFPYFSFPIDDRRKTGFLVPSIGSSDNSGLDIRVPYYFNISPNYDATFTPRYLQDRGVQLNTELRYLFRHQTGSLSLEYLPDDDKRGDQRNRITFQDRGHYGRHLSTRINYDRVSDNQYLQDLSDSLSLASITFLPRSAQIDYATAWWNLGLQIDDYQLLDDTVLADERPYQRLPRVRLGVQPDRTLLGTQFDLDAEFVHFFEDARVRARRTDLWPRLSWPVRRSVYEITPSVGYRYTHYAFDNQDPGEPSTLDRGTPVASLDNRLFFERDFDLFDRRYIQTLEPRLYYLYVAGREQAGIPLFDSSEPTFTYRELFRENRFYGADRMGDANQVALSLASRLLDPDSGAERLRVALGQLFYFEDRNVALDDSPPANEVSSDIAGEIAVALNRSWSALSDFIVNPRDAALQRTNIRLQYNPGFRQVANIAYRYRRGVQNQIDTSILWPLAQRWHFVGRWYYDVGASKVLENLAGLEYQSCCWSTRLVVRNFLDDTSGNTNRTILLQFTLKGLANFGSDVDSVLEDGILGYTRSPED